MCGVVAAAPSSPKNSSRIGHNDNVEGQSVEEDAGAKTSEYSGSAVQRAGRRLCRPGSQYCCCFAW